MSGEMVDPKTDRKRFHFQPVGRTLACILGMVVIPCVFGLGIEFAAARTVTVVCDDSGSMRNENRGWTSNYALQAIAALSVPADRFFVVPMNAEKVESGIIRQNGAVEIIKKIAKIDPDGNTPSMKVVEAINDVTQLVKTHSDGGLLVGLPPWAEVECARKTPHRACFEERIRSTPPNCGRDIA